MTSTIFVTGATGFLGHHLIPLLKHAGYHVRALVRPETTAIDFLAQHEVEIVSGNLQDRDSLVAVMQGAHAVIHAAAFFRFWGAQSQYEQVNVHGTANVLEAATRSHVEKFIHLSSVAVIGIPQGGVITEDYPCQPLDFYQQTKLAGEKLVQTYSAGSALHGIILRPGAFYGPGSHYAWNRLFFEDPLHGRLIQIHRGQRLTFPVYVPDVAQAILLSLIKGERGAVYNICGEPLTHHAANQIISQLAPLTSFRLNIPAHFMLWYARYQTYLAQRTGIEPDYPIDLAKYVFYDWNVSSQKARETLGFTPTPFSEGARATINWYREIGMLPK